MTDFFNTDMSMENMVARMASVDGISFRVLAKSADLRHLFAKSLHKLPTSTTGISNIVNRQSEKVKVEMKKEIAGLKLQGVKFSASIDEWTSTRNNSYMNVNLYSKSLSGSAKFRNLGLVRVVGSTNALHCISLLQDRLSDFDISIEDDLVCLTTDGCSMMCKIGRVIPAFHQKCLAHGLQLAVLDSLYKKQKAQVSIAAVHVESCSDSDSDNEGIEGFQYDNTTEGNTHRELVFEDVIQNVRKAVKIIKKSHVKQDILKKHSKDEFGKEIIPILDCRTRWSSLANMISRFLELKSCVQKTMIDIGENTINFSINDFKILEETSAALQVIKVTLESICRRDANLLTADTALKFCLKKLDSRVDGTSSRLADALRKRIKQYRLPEASLLQYLHNPKQYFRDIDDGETFERPVDSAALLATLYRRFNAKNMISHAAAPVIEEEDAMEVDGFLTEKAELEREIEKVMMANENPDLNSTLSGYSSDEDDVYTAIRVEKALFENGGDRGKHLKKCYDYLLSIPPTSVEAERAFSTAGYFCNKIRSSVSDNTLHSLCFLRSFYNDYRNSYVIKK